MLEPTNNNFMKSKQFSMKTSIIGAFLFTVAAVPALHAQTALYSNLGTAGTAFFTAATNEIGDEVILADNGNGSTITNFDLYFYNTAPDYTATMTVFLYANTGAPSSSGPNTPNHTALWSESFAVPNAPTGTLLNFATGTDLPLGGVSVPTDFTWAVEFTGLGGSDAGLILNTNAVDIGGNYADYWLNLGSSGAPNWVLSTNSIYSNVNFGADFFGTANPPAPTPEPSSVALMGLGIAGLVGFVKRKANRS